MQHYGFVLNESVKKSTHQEKKKKKKEEDVLFEALEEDTGRRKEHLQTGSFTALSERP